MVSEPAGVQLSLATVCETRFGTTAWQCASVEAVKAPGQVTVGAVVSTTVSTALQEPLLPEASRAVTVMVYEPTPTSVPASGFCTMVNEPAGVQLSLATVCETRFGTTAWQCASVEAVKAPVQVTVGAVVSTTVSTALQEPLLPEASVAATVMVYEPTPTSVPAGGFCTMISAPAGVQLSLATVCERRFGTTAWQFASVEAVKAPGQVIVG